MAGSASAASTAPAAATAPPLLTWDPGSVGANITLGGDDNRTATHATSQWNSVVGAQWLRDGLFELLVATDNVDNSSFFVGVCERGYWEAYVAAAEEGEEALPRDSKHAICMHGDGRLFIKGVEKDWGLMRLNSGEPLAIALDFVSGVVTFKQVRTVRGKQKEAVAEVAGLFGEATLVACFGGREQQLTIERATAVEDDGLPREKARDVFAGIEHVAPVSFTAPQQTQTYEEQVREVASAMENSM